MIEDLYQQMLEEEIGNYRGDTNRIRTAIYTGEYAFYLQHRCVKSDIPPYVHNDVYIPYFKIEIPSLSHDMCMYILTSLKDVFTIESIHTYGTSKHSRIYKELQAIGIAHMSRWITCHKDDTYTISIRHLVYKDCSTICRILFSW